ncbi:MAG TPA: hypothetical protein PLD54_00365 [Candidatus Levybacteria bacterium]|mgnify:CR=1 FL=1|nr:hypothetical protein [Candidatus Levybacteria bacterium]
MSAPAVLSVYKPVGITPLEALERLRHKIPTLQKEKLAYAGRLDPMAEGVLLVLVGDECKKRDLYQKLPKSYEVTGVFGISTDTYDALGMIQRVQTAPLTDIHKTIQTLLPSYICTFDQPYPPYSSARVNGKPLFYWAREGKIDTITIPSKHIEITQIQITDHGEFSGSELVSLVQDKINNVSGDFRQQEILETWRKQVPIKTTFPFITFTINSSHGAYMRSLIHDMGEKSQTGAIALHIKRLSVGNYHVDEALHI